MFSIYQRALLLFLLLTGSGPAGRGQSVAALTPVPDGMKNALTLDVGGNAPLIGLSYHRELIRFTPSPDGYVGAVSLAVGVGYVPKFCLFTCNQSSPTTHHALLLHWGRRLQGEIGYAGVLTQSEVLASNAYLPGAVVGLRFLPKTWLLRVYVAGLFNHDDKTTSTGTGDLVLQRTNYLALIPGLSIGKRF